MKELRKTQNDWNIGDIMNGGKMRAEIRSSHRTLWAMFKSQSLPLGNWKSVKGKDTLQGARLKRQED